MPADSCRACGQPFFPEPLLRFENMPAQAQQLPDEAAIAHERGVDMELVQCSACALVQLTNDPVPYYREVIRAVAFSEEMKAFRLSQFGDIASRYGLAGRRVLEIGCGRGEFLSVMVAAGMRPVGLEAGIESVQACLASGLEAHAGYVDRPDYAVPGGPFAAFFIHNFLEHFPDPFTGLRGMWNSLDEGGLAVVEVPNLDMILSRRAFSEFIGDHLLYFTTQTLSELLSRSGFDVMSCRPIWHDYVLSAECRRRSPLDVSSFHAHKDELAASLQAFVARFGPKRVAVWGAGHQALAVIALTGVGPRLRYVVDSAPFKQGRYTPATHVPIVAPERLNSDPVDAIVVMAAAYSDEVTRIIRARFDPRIQIAVLRESALEIV